MSDVTFAGLLAEIGCSQVWLARTLGITEAHVSRLKHGRVPMTRLMEVVMRALASGWRP